METVFEKLQKIIFDLNLAQKVLVPYYCDLNTQVENVTTSLIFIITRNYGCAKKWLQVSFCYKVYTLPKQHVFNILKYFKSSEFAEGNSNKFALAERSCSHHARHFPTCLQPALTQVVVHSLHQASVRLCNIAR